MLCGKITSIGALRQKHCCDALRQNHCYGALRTNHFHGRFAEKSLPQALCGKITAVSLYRKITSIGNLRRNQFHGRFAAKLLPRALCGKITAVALCGVSPRLPVLTAWPLLGLASANQPQIISPTTLALKAIFFLVVARPDKDAQLHINDQTKQHQDNNLNCNRAPWKFSLSPLFVCI